MKSLDPRVNRLPPAQSDGVFHTPAPLDQFGTFEVFVKPGEGKHFQHEGSVHAPDCEMAFILAKETFTRRFTCISLSVADTRDISVSPMAEANQNIWEALMTPNTDPYENTSTPYEIYVLSKRGKQHHHAGTVEAFGPRDAMTKAREKFAFDTPVLNLWAIPTSAVKFTEKENLDFWATLPEKKFRDASEYKGGDKLKNFIEERRHKSPTVQ